MIRRKQFCFGVLALCLTLGFGTGWADDTPDEEVIQIRTPLTKILVVAVPPRLINEGEVDTTLIRQSSSGLPVVGIGEQVYVAASPGGLETPTFAWSLAAAEGSSATLVDAAEAGKTFTPDVVGDYVVTLTITHAGGDTTLMQTVTAGKYVGVDRCGQCHPQAKETWEETGHAKMLQRGLSGTLSAHYRGSCVGCHSVSSNTSAVSAAVADNDGFEDVAAQVGWTFPANLLQGTWAQSETQTTPDALGVAGWKLDLTGSAWDDLPAELKALAGIQCENCHGPGSEHIERGLAQPKGQKLIGVSLENGVCAKCHDDGHYHVRPHEWDKSGHGKVWSRSSTSCAPCHTGSGYVQSQIKGEELTAGSFELGVTQTCGTCHEPHSVANEHQVRFAGTVTLNALVPDPGGNHSTEATSFTSGDLGTAAQCAQCHHLRPTRDVPGTSIHHSHQAEMVLGIGGSHYPGEIYPSGGHKHIDDVCATCHMAIPSRSDARSQVLGSHTWRMHDDSGTADDGSDDLYNTIGCEGCHGPIQNFDVNGAQTETEELLKVLADMLPHVDGHPGEVATYFSAGRHGSAARELTDAEKLAGWNQRFVEEDGSHGVHNFPYAQKLLVDAIRAMSPETPGSAMAGDFNGDNQVNFNDLFMFVSEFGKSEASAGWDAQFDLSGNGVVGFTDWVMFLDTFGQASASSKPVLVDNGRNRQFTFDLVGSNRSSIDRDHLGVTLTANHLTEMRGYGVYVSYDPAVLEFVRAVRADDGLMPVGDKTSVLSVRETEPGRVMISDAVVGNRPVGGSGQLADLIFRRLGPASANSVQIDLAQVADLTYGINRPSHAVEPAGKTALIYTLGQNFPNPFNPATTIHFSLADPGEVKIVVYNALGQAVRTLVENYRLAGDYSAIWDARDYSGREVASGVYVYQMEINGFSATQRMVLMR